MIPRPWPRALFGELSDEETGISSCTFQDRQLGGSLTNTNIKSNSQ